MGFPAARIPKRGEVYWVSFDNASGGEIRKTRPSIIVSNDDANATMNRVQVVPVTSQTRRVFPSEALITLKGEKHKAIIDQLQTAGQHRLLEFIARLSAADMAQIERAILVQLGINPRKHLE